MDLGLSLIFVKDFLFYFVVVFGSEFIIDLFCLVRFFEGFVVFYFRVYDFCFYYLFD